MTANFLYWLSLLPETCNFKIFDNWYIWEVLRFLINKLEFQSRITEIKKTPCFLKSRIILQCQIGTTKKDKINSWRLIRISHKNSIFYCGYHYKFWFSFCSKVKQWNNEHLISIEIVNRNIIFCFNCKIYRDYVFWDIPDKSIPSGHITYI